MQGDSQGIAEELSIWLYDQMVYVQRKICPGEWNAQPLLGFWDTNRLSNLGQTTRPSNNQQKKSCRIVDFVVPANHRVKLTESEKKEKYVDFTKELKKLWNMKVTVIPIVISALGTVTKRLVQGLEDLGIRGKIKTIQTTTLLRLTRILRRVLDNWEDLLSLKLLWETIGYPWCEKFEND